MATKDEYEVGAFYWCTPVNDPDAEEQWERERQIARYAGNNTWNALGIEGICDWPMAWVGEKIKPPITIKPRADHVNDAVNMVTPSTHADNVSTESDSVSMLGSKAPIDERVRFEAWIRENGISPYVEPHLLRDEEGDYKSSTTELYWHAWQAAMQLRQVPQWQPIESAPKDGFHYQLYTPELQFVGFWSGIAWCVVAPRCPIAPLQPTHWMPLPLSPNQIEAKNENLSR